MRTAPLQTLAGVKVLITRPSTENEPLSKKLRELGAYTIELPTIEILPPEDTDSLDRAIRSLSKYDWLVFTSVRGVEFFSKRMAATGKVANGFNDVKVAAIGPATAYALERLGKKPDYVPLEFLSDQIPIGMGDVNEKRFLLPRADIASKALPEALRNRGAIVDEVVAYRTVIPDGLSQERCRSILKEGVDVAAFTSPSTVRNLARIVGSSGLEAMLNGVKVACIGPVTAEAARELGIHVDIVAPNHTIDDLVEAIVNEIRTV